MTGLKQEEANEILGKLVVLRNKCKRSKGKKIHAEYRQYEEFCGKKFDYLVISRIRKYHSFPNYEDLKQDGRVALLSALRNFEPTKGSFFWWADRYITTKVKREANRHSALKIPLKQARTVQPYKVCQMPILIDPAPDALETIESSELKKQVREAIEKLPSDQRRVIELNGIKSYSISRISRELKIARPECVRLLSEAKKNLKQ